MKSTIQWVLRQHTVRQLVKTHVSTRFGDHRFVEHNLGKGGKQVTHLKPCYSQHSFNIYRTIKIGNGETRYRLSRVGKCHTSKQVMVHVHPVNAILGS